MANIPTSCTVCECATYERFFQQYIPIRVDSVTACMPILGVTISDCSVSSLQHCRSLYSFIETRIQYTLQSYSAVVLAAFAKCHLAKVYVLHHLSLLHVKDAAGYNVLHYAVEGGSIELVDWLIERHNLSVHDWTAVS